MVAATKDYRNADGCPVLTDVQEKKAMLEKQILQDHPHQKIMYKAIKNKNDKYFEMLVSIYNHKCAYCGARIGHTDIKLFEVDHFICESSYSKDTQGRAEAGRTSNLTFSCYSCNRGKGDFPINGKYRKLLNPDDGSIATVFTRDDLYYIRVDDTYSKDTTVQMFYKQLMLGSETRRLDYLLLEMSNLCSVTKAENPALAEKLEQCIGILLQRKNNTLI